MVQHIGCFGRNYPPIKNGKSAAFHHSPSLTSSLQQVDLVAWPRLPNGISHPPPATGWPGSQERFTPCWVGHHCNCILEIERKLDNALKTYVMKSRVKTSRVQKAFESYAKGFMYISQWAIYRREGFELHSIPTEQVHTAFSRKQTHETESSKHLPWLISGMRSRNPSFWDNLSGKVE